MTLASALKKKNRLANKINKLRREIEEENSARSDNNRKVDVAQLMNELQETIDNLIKLKLAIFIASVAMRENILKLSECKSQISFLQGLNVKEGKISDYGQAEPIEYSVIFDKIWVKTEIAKLEQEIDNMQEELDTFNHTTNIEV